MPAEPSRVTGTSRRTQQRLDDMVTEQHMAEATPPFGAGPPPPVEVPPDSTLSATQEEARRALGAVEVGAMLPSRYGPGAPAITLDDRLSRQILLLAQIHCTYDEISAVTEVSVEALRDHCAALIDLGHLRGRAGIRRRQYLKAVEEGNVQMLVWLGKNLLGQADRAVATLESNSNTNAGAVDPDAPEAVAEQAERVMAELRARVDTIRQNLEASTRRATEARLAAGEAHDTPLLEQPLVDVRRLPPPPRETQEQAAQRRGPHFIPHNQSLTPNVNLPRR